MKAETGGAPAPVETVDAYIAGFPSDVQTILEKIRRTIRSAAPGAQEAISYRIPTFKLNGTYLIYFAGFKTHVGLYPVPVDTAEFHDDLAVYGSGKATLKFPLDQPIPFDLITRVVKHKVKQSEITTATRTKRSPRT
jgi:uncharacterized protein YdhG (YjbR/CyaY superfamily)